MKSFLEIFGYPQPTKKQMKEKRFLVYKKINGVLSAEVQYGEHTTGEGQKKDVDEAARFEIKTEVLSLDHLKLIYPYKEGK